MKLTPEGRAYLRTLEAIAPAAARFREALDNHADPSAGDEVTSLESLCERLAASVLAEQEQG